MAKQNNSSKLVIRQSKNPSKLEFSPYTVSQENPYGSGTMSTIKYTSPALKPIKGGLAGNKPYLTGRLGLGLNDSSKDIQLGITSVGPKTPGKVATDSYANLGYNTENGLNANAGWNTRLNFGNAANLRKPGDVNAYMGVSPQISVGKKLDASVPLTAGLEYKPSKLPLSLYANASYAPQIAQRISDKFNPNEKFNVSAGLKLNIPNAKIKKSPKPKTTPSPIPEANWVKKLGGQLFAGGGPLGNGNPSSNETTYTYAARPGSYYKKDDKGQWSISNKGTGDKFIPIQDPNGTRAKVLNEQAKVNVPITNSPYALAASNFANNKGTDSKQAYIDKYQKSPELAKQKVVRQFKTEKELAKTEALINSGKLENPTNTNQPIDPRLTGPVSDNTRMVSGFNGQQAFESGLRYNSPESVEERKRQADWKKQKWDEYNKMSLYDKALDRTQAFAAHPLLMTGNVLAGNQGYIPGMGRGLLNKNSPEYDRYLQATGQQKGAFEVNDLFNMVNPSYWAANAGNELHKGNYVQGTAELGLGLLGLGQGKNLLQGSKYLIDDVAKGANYVGKTLGTESGLLPLQTQRLSKIANTTDNINSATKGTDYIWKNVNKNVAGELPEGITKQHIADIIETKVSWIESPEYLKRRMATTGETLEQVTKDVQKLKARYENTKIHFKPIKENVSGFYQSTPFRPSKDIIVIDPTRATSLDDMLGTIDHEIDHALSPAQKNNELYNNYPFMPTEEGDILRETLKQKPQNFLSKFIKGDKSKDVSYLELAPEQQVRFNRLNQKVREDLGLARNEGELTKAQFDEWINNQKNNDFEDLYKGHSDVAALLLNKSESMDRPAILKILNKAWGVVPIAGAVGGGAALMTNPWKKEPTTFADGGPLNDINNGQYLNSVYASALGNYYPDGGPINTDGPRATEPGYLTDSQMKAKMAYEQAIGNPAASRMLSLNPKTGMTPEGMGTHYMSSFDNYAVPTLQDRGGSELEYNDNPSPSREDFRFQTPEEANYFATHYKTVAPMMTGQYKNGGQFPTPYSLPEDNFKQGGNNLHNSVYASSPAQYPAPYGLGGYIGESTRQQMYMPLDHVTKNGGSILSMSNTPQLEGEGKDLSEPKHNYSTGGAILTSQLFK